MIIETRAIWAKVEAGPLARQFKYGPVPPLEQSGRAEPY